MAAAQVSPSRNQSRNRVPLREYRDDGAIITAPAYGNSVRIGYARVSTRAQEHQAQLDALAAAHCREIVIATASTRGDRPKLREALGQLQPGGDVEGQVGQLAAAPWRVTKSTVARTRPGG